MVNTINSNWLGYPQKGKEFQGNRVELYPLFLLPRWGGPRIGTDDLEGGGGGGGGEKLSLMIGEMACPRRRLKSAEQPLKTWGRSATRKNVLRRFGIMRE